MKINKKFQDSLEFVISDKNNLKIIVKNEVLYEKPSLSEPLKKQIQWDLSKPFLTGEEKFITHSRFFTIESYFEEKNNEKENILKYEHDCNTSKKIWWKHSICGHKYKLSVPNRLKDEPGCELCKYLKNPEYSFLNSAWDLTKNGKLEHLQSFFIQFHWKCHICKHEFKKSISDYKNNKKCHNCAKIAIQNKKIEKNRLKLIINKAKQEKRENKKLLEKPKIKFYLSSFIERRIYYLIKCMLEDIVLNGYKLQKTEIDIFIPTLKIAIEYDGVYWHKNKLKSDIKKNIKLKELDINLIRIREMGLNKIEPNDIIYDFNKADMNKLFKELTDVIKKNYQLTENNINSIDKFLIYDINKIQIPNEYLSNIPLEKSIGFKYPHLLKDWNFTLNADSDLFKLTNSAIKSKKKFWWKCNRCDFKFQEGLNERVGFCECPNCESYMGSLQNHMDIDIRENYQGEIHN